LKRVRTAEVFENKDGKLCIVTGFERFGVAVKMQTRMVNGAF